MSILKSIKKRNSLTTVLIVIGVGIGAFVLGRLSAGEVRTDIRVYMPNTDGVTASAIGAYTEYLPSEESPVIPEEGFVVASKEGSKYHFPWCSGATRIKPENKIIFTSNTEAREAGYEPAANCKGLE